MRYGLLSDIHENSVHLQLALEALSRRRCDRYLFLGDLFENGSEIQLTVELLDSFIEASPSHDALFFQGVWGNHDFGLCGANQPPPSVQLSGRVLHRFGTLRPSIRIDDSPDAAVQSILIQHIEPWLDPNSLEDLWSYSGDKNQSLDPEEFLTCHNADLFLMGHRHRWGACNQDGPVEWRGDEPLQLRRGDRHAAIIHAVCNGWCAMLDTKAGVLDPIRLVP
jgi:predicted phosphodiesterase